MSYLSSNFSCGVMLEDYIYASSRKINALVRIRINDGETEFITNFPESDLLLENQHSKAYISEDRIIFCPAWGNYIHIVDTKNKKIIAYDINRKTYWGEYYAIMYREDIILTPKKVGGNIIFFDYKNTKFSSVIMWEKIQQYFQDNAIYAFLRVAQIQELLFLPIYGTDNILVLNILGKDFELKKSGINNTYGVFEDNDELVILQNDSDKVYKWTHQNNCIESYRIDAKMGKNRFAFVKRVNGTLFFFPNASSNVISIEQDGIIREKLHMKNELCMLRYNELIISGKKLWALPYSGKNMLCISNNEIEELTISDIKMHMYDREKYVKAIMKSKALFSEEKDFILEDYILGVNET